VRDPANASAQPPDDALLWRVQGLHHEVVCYVVAADAGGCSALRAMARTTFSWLSPTRRLPTRLNARQFSARADGSRSAPKSEIDQSRAIPVGYGHFDFTLAIFSRNGTGGVSCGSWWTSPPITSGLVGAGKRDNVSRTPPVSVVQPDRVPSGVVRRTGGYRAASVRRTP
jgi:hypothetical protein